MAGFTDAELVEILTSVKKALTAGALNVRFPDGSAVEYESSEKLWEFYNKLVALQNAANPNIGQRGGFVVRTAVNPKGLN